MPRKDLPPVPEHPALSPPVLLKGEEVITIEGLAGEPALEARIFVPTGTERAVLLCHPHPLYGGTMHSAVPLAIAKVLGELGQGRVATLRFNYRGVGASEGEYDAGRGETFDARAALRLLKARAPTAKLSVCGYSFGTFLGLRAAAIERGVERVALVAPAVRIFDFVEEDASSSGSLIHIYVGDSDDFCDVDEAKELAATIGAPLDVFPESDHYFLRSRRKLAEQVAPFLAPETTNSTGAA
ncbi:MAG: dienelactone hydrolase family protein [Polyangiaceae bacterium]